MAFSLDDLPEMDAALLSRLMPLNDALRGAFCGLARLGVAFRRADAERAQRWITLLEPHPFYKLGQVMFDLLEFEDFMLDGDPPAITAQNILDLANQILEKLQISIPTDVVVPTDLPALETGFYLYRDVVLGLVSLALEAQAVSSQPTS